MDYSDLIYGSGFWFGWIILILSYYLITRYVNGSRLPLAVVYFLIGFDQLSQIGVDSIYVWGVIAMFVIVISDVWASK